MRRLSLLLLAGLILVLPGLSWADELNESQNPTEYSQEDSHPLRIGSYVLQPIGFALEWIVFHPLHYVISESPLAPALDSEHAGMENPAPIAELPPPDYLPNDDPLAKRPSVHEENLQSLAPPSPASMPSAASQPIAPPVPGNGGGQPELR